MKEKLKDNLINSFSMMKEKKDLLLANKKYMVIKTIYILAFLLSKTLSLCLLNIGYFFVYKKIQKNISEEKKANIFTVCFAISLSTINYFMFSVKNNLFIFWILLLLVLTESLILILMRVLKKNKMFVFAFLCLFFIVMSFFFSIFFKQKILPFTICNLLILFTIGIVNVSCKILKICTILNSNNKSIYQLKNFIQLTFSFAVISIFNFLKLLNL